MTAILLPLGLGFIMFSIGLGLTIADFTRVVRQPLALGAGLVNQMVLLPLLAAGLVLLYSGPPLFALGLMALAACPGGITSNLLTVLGGGRAALSVSMTALSSLFGIVTIPLILGLSQGLLLGESTPVHLPIPRILVGVFGVTGLPIALGMGINRAWPGLAARIRPTARTLATAIFAAIVVAAFIGQREAMVTHFASIGPFVIALNLGTMALGMMTARLLGLDLPDAIAITLEAGLQNAALAIFIATSLLNLPAMVVPAILYALVMNVSAAGFIAWSRWRLRLSAASTGGATPSSSAG